MALHPLKAVDGLLSRLLRYDLSRTDVLKWVFFARQMLLMLLLSVVTIAGLSSFLAIKQTEAVLRDSLERQATTMARAAARFSYVPLALEDDAALKEIGDTYLPSERISLLSISDAAGRSRYEFARDWPSLRASVPVLPVAENGRKAEPIGSVEIGLRTDWIDAEARRAASVIMSVSGALALAVFSLGALLIGRLVARTRELVGEARLVEEVRRVNAELETFSYSVAHDLRAPVRAIDGFSAILAKDYAGALGTDGAQLLERVRAASRRMALLIDDLLALSRVTRAELRRQRIDLSGLAAEVAAELSERQPERAVELCVAPGLEAVASAELMTVALENLLGNAWKYTRRAERPRVEVGRRPDGAFFVRDNGAGFDMAYVNKLFKPFSRLHSPSEFEGTGVGLATVLRIIERHGGRLWGEGAVGKGAVFYFTLPEVK